MNNLSWLRYFQNNSLDRPEQNWNAPRPDHAELRQKLARSLSHFQLGESGEGGYLLAQARARHPEEVTYYQALAAFILEEKEHARLLARLVARFDGTLLTRHWTHALFRQVRRRGGLNFEVQVLVIAEIVGASYYRLLQLRTRDSVLEQICALILRDEAKHIEFHAERLGNEQQNWLPATRALWSAQFQALFVAAAAVAWIDHGECLTALGSSRDEFTRTARRECNRFLHRCAAHASADDLPSAGLCAGLDESTPLP